MMGNETERALLMCAHAEASKGAVSALERLEKDFTTLDTVLLASRCISMSAVTALIAVSTLGES